jgi:sulfite reductase alpha subunit-like flavoprotein
VLSVLPVQPAQLVQRVLSVLPVAAVLPVQPAQLVQRVLSVLPVQPAQLVQRVLSVLPAQPAQLVQRVLSVLPAQPAQLVQQVLSVLPELLVLPALLGQRVRAVTWVMLIFMRCRVLITRLFHSVRQCSSQKMDLRQITSFVVQEGQVRLLSIAVENVSLLAV